MPEEGNPLVERAAPRTLLRLPLRISAITGFDNQADRWRNFASVS